MPLSRSYPPPAINLPSGEKTWAPGGSVLTTLAVATSTSWTASPINVTATCLPSGVKVNHSVGERPPPALYLSLRSSLPVAASQKRRNLSSLVARVFPSGDRPTASGYSSYDPCSFGRE